jgi:hypothetical protein
MKGFFILSVTLCTLTSQAQVKLQLFAGPDLSTAAYSVKGTKQSTDYKFVFHAGAGYKIPFENKLSFTPSVTYQLSGYKVQFNTPSFPPDLLAKDNNTTLHQVALNAALQFDFSNHPSHFFVKAGPSISVIVAGREKYNLATGESVDRGMKFSLVDSYGRYNMAVIIQCGYETGNGFIISGGYQQFLFSMNNEDSGPFILNHLAGITLGKYIHTGK